MIFFLMCINFPSKESKSRERKNVDSDLRKNWSAGSGSALESDPDLGGPKSTHKSEEKSCFEVLDVFF
jgi:hypothetical protein